MATSDEHERVDPGRSMRLLWGLERRGRRGPKPRLDLDDIVDDAIDLADEAGIDALSMRALADRLEVGAMTLYGYVQAKRDLLDLMYDRVVGRAHRDVMAGLPDDATWRDRLEAIARNRWELHRRHPWFSRMPFSRPPLGPNVLDAYEEAVGVLAGLGLTGRERTDILTSLSAFVDGSAAQAREATSAPDGTAAEESAWWEAVGPVFEEVFDPERFPELASPGMADAWDPPDAEQGHFLAEAVAAFEFGLQRLLDGIESWVESRP